MLRVVTSFSKLNIGQLLKVYSESILADAQEKSTGNLESVGILSAEQCVLSYLVEFFAQEDAFLALWVFDDSYVSAVRMEPYKDGYLLSGLETAPDARRCGYATALLQAVLRYMHVNMSGKVYSHVDKKNVASLAVHAACGFQRVAEHAVYLDGSVFTSSCTLCFDLNENKTPDG